MTARRWIHLAIGLTLCGCASAPKSSRAGRTSSSNAADKLYDIAVGSFHNGLYEDAKIQLSKALAEQPEHADSHYLQGVLLLNEGKAIVDAIEISACLTDEAALQQRARARELHRDAKQAFARAAQAYAEGTSGRGRAYNSLAVVSLFFNEFEAAARSARDALGERFYTDRFSALANLGWAQFRMGDSVGATASLRQAILVNPDYCVGRYRLARVYLDGELNSAARTEAQAVVDHASCPIQDAYRIVGVAEIRMGAEQNAQIALAQCLELAPASCKAQDCRALLGAAATEGDPRAP